MGYKIEILASHSGIETFKVDCDGSVAYGSATFVPTLNASILEVSCAFGLLLCGIFSIDTLNKFNVPAAVFSAPRPEDIMERTPKALTDAALEKGASYEMTGAELLKLFS